jgi:hypothetical protein
VPAGSADAAAGDRQHGVRADAETRSDRNDKRKNTTNFTVTLENGGGKKLFAKSKIVALKIATSDMDGSLWVLSTANGTTGTVVTLFQPTQAVPAGKWTVKVTVTLDDKSTIMGEGDVDFQKLTEETLPGGPLPPPPGPEDLIPKPAMNNDVIRFAMPFDASQKR